MLSRLDLQKMKHNKQKISMITAYDYPSAKVVEEADVDMILVGDSLGMVVLGYASTVQVTVDDMVHHAKAVKRGAPDTFMVVDMPFMSYHISLEDSLANAQKIFQQTDAQAIKIEGASTEALLLTERLSEAGIPVVAHLGLTPQSVHVLGGYKVQGNDSEAAEKLLQDAKAIAERGAIALVLECVPKELASIITNALTIPTIGIGAGINCDGQVLVYHDILQYGVSRVPKFVKTYADYNSTGIEGIRSYVSEVRQESFPKDEHSFTIKNADFLPTD
ncbi:3-methyl-2-oxobutanoate hydroxymethyltransferase [Virgibacillus byunsanensis]|uniref:3-methyl-2-oxobutanoate hydroxymethyltransferase n=1 Tax=Virgibacillus byunsanensis TaxID=570945 RepID=A0ABW3LN36_9BACI